MSKSELPDSSRKTYHESLTKLVREAGGGQIVEVGVFEHKLSTHLLLEIGDEITNYTMIDIWRPMPNWSRMKTWEQADNLALEAYRMGYAGSETIRLPSLKAATLFKDESLDMVYIDAEKATTIKDLEVWYPKVKIGGIIAGHDYQFPEVREAVGRFASLLAIIPGFFPDDRWEESHPAFWDKSVWYWKK